MAAGVAIAFSRYLQHDQPSLKLKTQTHKTSSSHKLPPILLGLLILINILQIAKMMITPMFALFVSQQLHGNNLTIGILYAATGVGLFLFAPIWGRYFDAKKQQGESIYGSLAIILLASSIIQFSFAYSSSIALDLVLRFAWGGCLGALIPQLFALLTEQRAQHQLGKAIGFAHSALKIGSIIGIALGAMIMSTLGFEGLFISMACLYLLAAVFVLYVEFSARRFPTRSVPTIIGSAMR